MAKSLNQLIIMGNVTRTPDIKQTPSGNSVVSFSLALNRSYKDAQDQWQEATDYVDVVAWGKLADQVAVDAYKAVRGKTKTQVQSVASWKYSHKMSHS